MNIDSLTIREAKEIAGIFNNQGYPQPPKPPHGAIGQKCIVRTYASGVHFGEVVSVSSNGGRSRCELKNSRRLWRWEGGLSLSEISQSGIDQPKSRISTTVPVQFIEDVLEFIPASPDAIATIEGAKDDDC